MQQQRKRVLLGVTGCIAAYKSCEVLRGLQRAGVDVQVVMTENAERFVGVATFEALSGYPVGRSLFGDDCGPIPHIELAGSCDLFLIVPCTANVLAKVAHGIADDLLTSTVLATTAPIVIAPAMNVHMYENPATQRNIEAVRARGMHVLDAASGHLACGEVGPGKLPDPDDIVRYALDILDGVGALRGKRVLITSGPTIEPIDPVRFISNRSSGKMGAALAQAALDAGADVTVISGPVAVSYPGRLDVISVQTAQEMHDAALAHSAEADIVICAAAVSDLRPDTVFPRKLKKGADDDSLSQLRLIENPDILKVLGDRKREGQVVVGFAAETDDLLENARKKLASKHADMIVANEVGEGKAFGQDTNEAVLVTASATIELPKLSKSELARIIIEQIGDLS